MNKTQFFQHLRALIAADELQTALQKLQTFLEHSPRLNEAILQMSRFQAIQQQIRIGVVSHKEASLTKNQIRAGLLDFINELEQQGNRPLLQAETEKAISIVESKNFVVGNIQNSTVNIGDTTHTESKSSRQLRFFLFLFVPLLAIGLAFFGYRYQQMQAPLYLKVQLKNKTPNPELPEPVGTLTFSAGQVNKTKTEVSKAASFDDIPPYLSSQTIHLNYKAKGFIPIDTSLVFPSETLTLALRRNDDFATIQGVIKDEAGQALEGVNVSILACCATLTDETGAFSLKIPFDRQKTQQRLELSKTTYKSKSVSTPVYKNEIIRLSLEQLK